MNDNMCNIPDDILEKLQKDVGDIRVALLGNEYNPEGGILCRTKQNEEELQKLKQKVQAQQDKFNKVVWTGIGVGSGAGFIWYIVTEVFSKIIGG